MRPALLSRLYWSFCCSLGSHMTGCLNLWVGTGLEIREQRWLKNIAKLFKKTAKSKHCGLGKPFEHRCNFLWLACALIPPPAFTAIFTATFVFLTNFLVQFDSTFAGCRTFSRIGEVMVMWGKWGCVETFLLLPRAGWR